MIDVVTTLAHSFLIGSSSFLQATRTPIKLGWVRNRAVSDEGLIKLPLSVWKNPHRLIMGEMLCPF